MKKEKLVSRHIDRGKSVTDALKQILGARCQICHWIGFIKKNGERYIEAHHLTQLSLNKKDSLCSDNIILVCPNCHRQLHHAKNMKINDLGEKIHIIIEETEAFINKNTIEHLRYIKRK
ncbi:MAG: HNH endonuclease [Bacillota bacterium]